MYHRIQFFYTYKDIHSLIFSEAHEVRDVTKFSNKCYSASTADGSEYLISSQLTILLYRHYPQSNRQLV